MAADKIDTIVSLSKRRGFVFPCSEIYGGQRAAWDYGPLGVELKENIKRQWWRYMVTSREDVVGIDSSVILAPEVWVASGHVATFTDPLTECTSCHKRFRADHLEEAYEEKKGHAPANGLADHLFGKTTHLGNAPGQKFQIIVVSGKNMCRCHGALSSKIGKASHRQNQPNRPMM